MNARPRTPARPWFVLALAALLGLTIAVVSGAANASATDHAGIASRSAVIAKKKCKKGKKSASVAKKKCKKKVTAPAPTPPTPGPTLRATATWNSTADLDLIAWAPDGTVGFVYSNSIPNTQFSTDDLDGFGPETFTDLTTPNRQFDYGVCVASDGTPSTTATIQYRRADGTTGQFTSSPGDLQDEGDLFLVQTVGGFNVTSNPCPVF